MNKSFSVTIQMKAVWHANVFQTAGQEDRGLLDSNFSRFGGFQPWMQSAHELLDFLVSREDATPFRHPVDLNENQVS